MSAMDTDRFNRARACFDEVVGWLEGVEATALTHGELEEELDRRGRELLRVMLQDQLDLRALRETRAEEVYDADGIGHGTVESGHVRPLSTIFGTVSVTRLAYRHRGHANLYPTDGRHYRNGDIADSQAVRSAHGWERQHQTPAATRDALAAAAVADADRLGADQVAVLAVSHADCEDLAHRIRGIRIARGELADPVLTGPGWGPNVRRYAAGDRILFHTSLVVDGRRFTNGTTGTIAAIRDSGAVAAIDDGTALVIPAGFVAGERIDGTPNMSHGWARTIDGAQGGTWEQVHLLATPNLDRLTAYVGQSRGRAPTHTWNTTPPLSGEEHGNVVADPRDPAAQIPQVGLTDA